MNALPFPRPQTNGPVVSTNHLPMAVAMCANTSLYWLLLLLCLVPLLLASLHGITLPPKILGLKFDTGSAFWDTFAKTYQLQLCCNALLPTLILQAQALCLISSA